MFGLRITARMGTPAIPSTPDGRIHLDSVLAFSAMRAVEHTLPPTRESVSIIDIPGLKCLWRDNNLRPLWACSDMFAVGDFALGREHAHRRYPSHRSDIAKKSSANTQAGQYKEARKQIKTISTESYQAIAIGDAEIILKLLREVPHIGSRIAAGYGKVLRWDVEIDNSVTIDSVLRAKPVPLDAALEFDIKQLKPTVRCGWTPPYWYQNWYEQCVEPSACSFQS